MRGNFGPPFCCCFGCRLLCRSGARAAEPSPSNARPAPVSVDEPQWARAHTLQDDAARTTLVEELRALIAARRGAGQRSPRRRRSSDNCLSRSMPSPAKSWPVSRWCRLPRLFGGRGSRSPTPRPAGYGLKPRQLRPHFGGRRPCGMGTSPDTVATAPAAGAAPRHPADSRLVSRCSGSSSGCCRS